MTVQSGRGGELRRKPPAGIAFFKGIFRSGLPLEYERLYELIEKHRNPVGQLRISGLWIGPAADHDTTTVYQERAIRQEKIRKHAA
jgi:hypothetical protein